MPGSSKKMYGKRRTKSHDTTYSRRTQKNDHQNDDRMSSTRIDDERRRSIWTTTVN